MNLQSQQVSRREVLGAAVAGLGAAAFPEARQFPVRDMENRSIAVRADEYHWQEASGPAPKAQHLDSDPNARQQ